MKPSTLDTTNPASWPVVMRLADVAAIFCLAPATVQKQSRRGTFRPVPMPGKPLRWRRVDVLRAVEPTPLPMLGRRSA